MSLHISCRNLLSPPDPSGGGGLTVVVYNEEHLVGQTEGLLVVTCISTHTEIHTHAEIHIHTHT
jgi:hypothetical protein